MTKSNKYSLRKKKTSKIKKEGGVKMRYSATKRHAVYMVGTLIESLNM